jgi:hypothetical protein
MEAMRTGMTVGDGPLPAVPGEDERLQVGDPDVDPLENELSGDELPGGDMPTPDQSNVDEIGRAYGLTDQDSGSLVLGDDLLVRRDARRWASETPSPRGPNR